MTIIEQARAAGVNHAVDAGGFVAVMAMIAGWLPGIITGLVSTIGIIWYGLQIYESHTFQSWLKRRKAKREQQHG